MVAFMEKLRRMHQDDPSRSKCACDISLPSAVASACGAR
jgi:hypothetical protein